jgi:hypothetical protein
MDAYENDPRVVKVSEEHYVLPSPEGWQVVYVPEIRRWYGVAQVEDYGQPVVGHTADETIAQIIGDPQ